MTKTFRISYINAAGNKDERFVDAENAADAIEYVKNWVGKDFRKVSGAEVLLPGIGLRRR